MPQSAERAHRRDARGAVHASRHSLGRGGDDAEALDIAAALGCEPSIDIERRLEGARKVGDHKPSMLQDWEAGKPLELAAVVTAVIELARLAGIPAPRLEAVHAATQLAGHRADESRI
jgi:ketopantoate reductase